MTIKQFFQAIKTPLLTTLENELVKAAIKKFVLSGPMLGLRTWAITFIVEKLFDDVAKPVIDLAFRKLGYIVEVTNGNVLLKKIQNASDASQWDDLTNRV